MLATKFSLEVTDKASTILRKMAMRVFIQTPQLLDYQTHRNLKEVFAQSFNLFEKKHPIHFEWMVIQELFEEGARGTANLHTCLDKICEKLHRLTFLLILV